MRRYIVAGNWKMNSTLNEAKEIARGVRDRASDLTAVQRVLVPPFPWIVPVFQELEGSDISVGAQNCYSEPAGAFTGEVSAEMLAPFCSHVILGHSERRHVLNETDEEIVAKVAAVLRTSMSVILCVGETLDDREAGSAQQVVGKQLESALKSVSTGDMSRIVIAYEPVWAIGTGVAASADDAQEMASFVRQEVAERFDVEIAGKLRVQYGGSVKADNAAELMACPDVDGALVGGASLNADEFCGIIRAAHAQRN
jgi:triosephosphate isomerase (TIM)